MNLQFISTFSSYLCHFKGWIFLLGGFLESLEILSFIFIFRDYKNWDLGHPSVTTYEVKLKDTVRDQLRRFVHVQVVCFSVLEWDSTNNLRPLCSFSTNNELTREPRGSFAGKSLNYQVTIIAQNFVYGFIYAWSMYVCSCGTSSDQTQGLAYVNQALLTHWVIFSALEHSYAFLCFWKLQKIVFIS